jgi:hypothetical protein
VAEVSKARNIFARPNTRIVISNPAPDIEGYPLFSVFVLSYVGSGLATGWSHAQAVLPTVYKSYNFRLILKGNRPQGLIRQEE